jgi:lipopolysaccharide export system permease protein
MLKKIDRYILGKFIGTFFLVLMIIMSIAVVFDVAENLEDFIKNEVPLKAIVFEFYFNFVLYYGNLFSSMIVFISTILFTSQMANRTEIVAILTGGVSFNRFLVPYFIGATMVATGSYLLNHYLIPTTNEIRSDFEAKHFNTTTRSSFQNIHRQVRPGELVFIENFNFQRRTGYRFTYERFENQEMRCKIAADFIRYDSIEGFWTLDNYTIRYIDDIGVERLERGRKLDTIMPFKPADLTPGIYDVETIPTPELRELIKAERIRGAETITIFLINHYSRTSWPAATYVLVLIAVSLSSRKRRGGLGLNIAIGLIICVVYIFFMQISVTFATNGNLAPWLAVWLPNIGFGILALYLYRIAPK